jgi:hypothetical protein
MKKLLYLFWFLMLIAIGTRRASAQSNAMGPGMIEYGAFEPVDATDMVNLITGDFSYVIPLLSVPSPEGGYPLSLSYHAGIPMNMDASWTGLGWNINPGAINRILRGEADDNKSNTVYNVIYDAGGTTDVKDFRISVGVSVIQVNAFWGSHRSFGGDVSLGMRLGEYGGAGVSLGSTGIHLFAGMGVGPSAIGVRVGTTGFALTGSAMVSGMEVGFSTGGSLYSSVSTPVSQQVHGGAKMSPSDYHVSTSGTYFMIPLVFSNFTYNRTTYSWSLYNAQEDYVSGTMYAENARNSILTSGQQNDSYSMDVYSEPFSKESYYDVLDRDAGNKGNNLLFPNYDSYLVAAQGMGGTMTPRIYDFGTLLAPGRIINRFALNIPQEEIVFSNDGNTLPSFDKIQFGFDGEHNSYMRVAPGAYSFPSGTTNPVSLKTYSAGSLNTTSPDCLSN